MENDHKTQDLGRSFGRSDDREKLATWPASLVSELAENRRVRLANNDLSMRLLYCLPTRAL